MSSKKGKRLNPFQHALLRPDTYIGSVTTVTKEIWVYEDVGGSGEDVDADADGEEDTTTKTICKGGIVLKKIRYNNGLTRIFVEIMSNAIDNKWRSEKHGIKMKGIDFTIDNDPDSEYYGWITIKNDGYCIPVRKESYELDDYRNGTTVTEEMYPAEVFFGEMLAGTNFEEDEERKTSGRNGMGGKATIVFSKEDIIEHTNPEDGKMFTQTYYDNGTRRDKPKITSFRGKTGTFSFSFLPDYEYFGYPGMDEDLFSLFKRYVYECAMLTGLKVTLNGEKVEVKDLQKFARLVYPNPKENCMFRFVAPNGDECVLMENGIPDQYEAKTPAQISWINGINTRDGGVHVDAWVKTIFPTLVKAFNARKKKGDAAGLKTTANKLYPYFTIFVRGESYGVKFDSQTKDCLTQPDPYELVPGAGDKKNKKAQQALKTFTGSIGEAMKKILKWGFVGLLEDKLSMFADQKLSKTENAKSKHVALGKKGHDAYYAGKKSEECTLGIYEGLSAKTFGERLMGNPDYIGGLALRGKFINVQTASKKEVNINEEVAILKRMMKLVTGVNYADPEMRKMLRYGKVVIMADQDDDGLHIRGLVLNFFYTFWPSLFDLKAADGTPMIQAFNTAVCITRIGKKIDSIHFSNPGFKQYWETLDEKKKKKLYVKYYKGLGTHDIKDIALYRNDPKYVHITLDGDELEWMTLGFDKKNSDQRKEWITRDMPKPGEVSLSDPDSKEFTYEGPLSLSLFVDEQLIIYHKMTLRRALPNMYDGFKEGPRKVFYGISNEPKARKHPLNLEMLAGSIKSLTGYHHGAVSLYDTIIGMAQGFVGANNVPLLCNAGMYGSRKNGGDDAAAPRYIATAIEEVARSIFREEDEPLYTQSVEDSEKVEYQMYMPVVPIILINGAEGIASGYSTRIEKFNPDHLVERMVWWIDSDGTRESLDEFELLTPWYRGWTGTPEFLQRSSTNKGYEPWDPSSDKKPIAWLSKGTLTEGKKGWWHITELPIGMWTYKLTEWLDYFSEGTPPEKKKWKKIDRCILDVRDRSESDNSVSFDFKPTKDFIPDMTIANNFKILQKTHSLTNMHVIDENGYPRKYKCAEDLLHDFCIKRLEYYGLRKQYWIEKWGKELERENNRYKYVKLVADGKLKLNQKLAKVEEDMLAAGLKKLKPINETSTKKVDSEGVDEEAEDTTKATFKYLLMMPTISCTSEKMAAIKKKMDEIQAKIDDYTNKTPGDLWKIDLKAFLVAYKKFLTTRCEEYKEE